MSKTIVCHSMITSFILFFSLASYGSETNILVEACPGDDANKTLLTAVGGYLNNKDAIVPLIINSHAANHYWTSVPQYDITPPDTHDWSGDSTLNGVTCDKSNRCIGIGEYRDEGNGATRTPWIINGPDKEGKWLAIPSHDIIPPHGDSWAGDASIYSIRCNKFNLHCTAVGYYNNGMTDAVLILNGPDHHGKWKAVEQNDIKLPDTRPQEGAAYLYSLDCDNNGQCISVGYYDNGAIVTPLILKRHDYTSKWKAVDSSDIKPPDGHNWPGNGGVLQSVSCEHKNHCTAIGYYDNGQVDVPLIMNSLSNGKWRSVSSKHVRLPADIIKSDSAYLYSISCSGGKCTSVGNYPTADAPAAPLIMNGPDTKGNWTGVDSADISLPAGNYGYTFLYSITCDHHQKCLGTGSYATGDITDGPLIINGPNHNGKWSAVSPNHISLPKDFVSGQLSGFSSGSGKMFDK